MQDIHDIKGLVPLPHGWWWLLLIATVAAVAFWLWKRKRPITVAETVVPLSAYEVALQALQRLRDARVNQIIVTDSIPLTPEKQLPKIHVLSVAPLLADAIKRIHFNESVSKLFE